MNKTILVGEDDDAIGDIITSILQSEHYTVLLAKDEQDMFHHLKTVSPDMIFLDIWLAGNDGSKIAKEIKSTQTTKHIPVVLMSADTKTAKIAHETGADNFLLKPFSLDALLTLARQYTNNIISH